MILLLFSWEQGALDLENHIFEDHLFYLYNQHIAKHMFSDAGVPKFAPLYRYWKPTARDHFYTTKIQEIGTAVPGRNGNHGYTSEGIVAVVRAEPAPGTMPLYRYWQGAVADHFYTTNRNEIGTITPGVVGKHGYQSEGIAGFCFPAQYPNTVPLYRYWNGAAYDHFYTTNPAEIGTITPGQVGNHGYRSEGIVCYAYPSIRG